VDASPIVNSASTAFANTNDAPTGAKTIIVIIRAPIKRLAATTAVEVTPVSLRLSCQEGVETGML
jgi:hypothetical protein